jgi:predicted O-methyltransferase YrrM
MGTSQHHSSPDIDGIARAFMESRALLTAIELDVFTAVGEGATADEAAARMGADARATEMLLNALVAMGLVTKHDGVFCATPEAARRLAGDSGESERAALMHTVGLWDRWSTLTEAVRRGTRVLERDRTPEQLEAFIAAMHRGGTERAAALAGALDLSNKTRALDVGGGSGAYSIALARANENLRCVVFDLEGVTAIAERHLAEAGLGDRVTTRSGDFHSDDFDDGYDLVLISQILHMLSPEEGVALLKKSRDALVPGGEVVIQDFILDDDKTSPRRGALFALNMLVATRSGNAYSGAEYLEWLERAGFTNARVVPLSGVPTGLVVGVKR